jgi:hypothetical protein
MEKLRRKDVALKPATFMLMGKNQPESSRIHFKQLSGGLHIRVLDRRLWMLAPLTSTLDSADQVVIIQTPKTARFTRDNDITMPNRAAGCQLILYWMNFPSTMCIVAIHPSLGMTLLDSAGAIGSLAMAIIVGQGMGQGLGGCFRNLLRE